MSDKKNYMMGDSTLSEEQKNAIGKANASQQDILKEIHSRPKEEIKQHDWSKAFPWKMHDDRVVIFPDPADQILPSGIIIPDTGKERPQSGLVVALGDELSQNQKIMEKLNIIGRLLMASRGIKDGDEYNFFQEESTRTLAKVGQRAVFGRYAGTEITVDDVKYIAVRYSDIFASL